MRTNKLASASPSNRGSSGDTGAGGSTHRGASNLGGGGSSPSSHDLEGEDKVSGGGKSGVVGGLRPLFLRTNTPRDGDRGGDGGMRWLLLHSMLKGKVELVIRCY